MFLADRDLPIPHWSQTGLYINQKFGLNFVETKQAKSQTGAPLVQNGVPVVELKRKRATQQKGGQDFRRGIALNARFCCENGKVFRLPWESSNDPDIDDEIRFYLKRAGIEHPNQEVHFRIENLDKVDTADCTSWAANSGIHDATPPGIGLSTGLTEDSFEIFLGRLPAFNSDLDVQVQFGPDGSLILSGAGAEIGGEPTAGWWASARSGRPSKVVLTNLNAYVSNFCTQPWSVRVPLPSGVHPSAGLRSSCLGGVVLINVGKMVSDGGFTVCRGEEEDEPLVDSQEAP